tara:strand:+ start:453 stop:824 length:372 start_codon:yes stop_codon:yes gene_type:complete
MKKLILTIIISLFSFVSVNAEEDRLESLPGVWWESVPSVCVPNDTLKEFADRKDFQPLSMSYGRNGGQPDGDIVYIITFWVSIESNQQMASVQVPNGEYSCVLYRTFDTKMNLNFDFQPKVST